MRVWELADELCVLSSDILELIKPHDAYVSSHLATIPRQALEAILASPPEPRYGFGEYWQWHKKPPGLKLASDSPPSAPTPKKPYRYRRRPGPAPVSFEPPYEEDERGYGNDPLEELEYEPIWSTRDVANYYGVKPATVRQWVQRGHLEPCGKEGASHIFERKDVYAATDTISARRRKAGHPDPERPQPARPGPRDPFDEYLARFGQRRRPAGYGPDPEPGLAGVGTRALHRLATVTPNALVTTDQAASLIGLTASTIRSWVRRGHLRPAPAAPGERGHRFRVYDLYRAARRQ